MSWKLPFRRPKGEPFASPTQRFGLIRLLPVTSNYLPDQNHATGKERFHADIIAVHGLGGDAFRTWTHENGTLWLRDFAPEQFPGARVYTFGYDSAFAFSQGSGMIRDFARSLLEDIRAQRTVEEVSHAASFLNSEPFLKCPYTYHIILAIFYFAQEFIPQY
jgi:hypothetical protein